MQVPSSQERASNNFERTLFKQWDLKNHAEQCIYFRFDGMIWPSLGRGGVGVLVTKRSFR